MLSFLLNNGVPKSISMLAANNAAKVENNFVIFYMTV